MSELTSLSASQYTFSLQFVELGRRPPMHTPGSDGLRFTVSATGMTRKYVAVTRKYFNHISGSSNIYAVHHKSSTKFMYSFYACVYLIKTAKKISVGFVQVVSYEQENN